MKYLIISTCIIFTACSSTNQKSEGLKASFIDSAKTVAMDKPVVLKLKGVVGQVEKVAYSHRALSKSFEKNEIRNQRDESVEFTTAAETMKYEGDTVVQKLSVIKKDGTTNLHDFAMPEVGEKVEVVFDHTGKIKKFGDYPQNSLFYVPPVSLPDRPVTVGDTWTMKARWITLDETIPFELDMVSILKRFVSCGNDTCAEIEVSGEVNVDQSLKQTLHFNSQWRGGFYFAMNAGSVIWSHVQSEEQLLMNNLTRKVQSCLGSTTEEPSQLKLADKASCIF